MFTLSWVCCTALSGVLSYEVGGEEIEIKGEKVENPAAAN